MYDSNSKGISYAAGFFMLIAFAIAGIIAAGLIAEQLWVSMTGKDISVFSNNMMTPSDSDAMKVVQAVTAIVGFLLPAVLTAFMLNSKPFRLLGFSPGPNLNQAGLAIVIILVAMIISVFAISYLNREIPLPTQWKIKAEKWEEDYNHQVQVILQMKTSGDYILALVIMAFLPALCEEALFRGGLQNFLTRATGNPWLSVIIVSLIFSAVHFSFFGFFPRLFLGAVLGLLFHYSGKLWLCILAHFINNAFGITMLYLYIREGRPMKEAMGQDNNQWWGILLIPVLVLLFGVFKKISAQKNRNSPAQ